MLEARLDVLLLIWDDEHNEMQVEYDAHIDDDEVDDIAKYDAHDDFVLVQVHQLLLIMDEYDDDDFHLQYHEIQYIIEVVEADEDIVGHNDIVVEVVVDVIVLHDVLLQLVEADEVEHDVRILQITAVLVGHEQNEYLSLGIHLVAHIILLDETVAMNVIDTASTALLQIEL